MSEPPNDDASSPATESSAEHAEWASARKESADQAAVLDASHAPPSQGLTVFGAGLEDVFKLTGALLALCYGIGLLIVQLYLVSIGVADFEPLRTRYVLTGFSTLAPLCAAVYAGIALAVLFKVGIDWVATDAERKASREYRSSFRRLALLLLLAAVYFLSTALVILPRGREGLGWSIELVFILVLLLSVLMLTFSVVLTGFPRIMLIVSQAGDHSHLLRLSSQVSAIALLAWFAIMYLILVANTLFPVIPEQLGGGQPRTVQLILSKDAVPWLGDLVPLSGDTANRSRSMDLLWETESMLVLREPGATDGTVIQLDRDVVEVVIVDPPSELQDFPSTPPTGTVAPTLMR